MEFDIARTDPHDVYNLLIGLVVPRPIALVTTLDPAGRLNAAPFSSYNYLSVDPPIVGLGVANRPGGAGEKDTSRNIRATGEFVINVVNEPLAEAMNVCATDFPPGEDEVAAAGLETAPSALVKPPRIAAAPAHLECRLFQILDVGNTHIVLGKVVLLHVNDAFVDPKGPYVRADAMHNIGRMNGGGNYVRTRDAFFRMDRIPYAEWKKTHAEGPGGRD